MTLFRFEIPAGDYEGRILADCNTVRLLVPGVGVVELPVDGVTEAKPPLPAEPPAGIYAAGRMVWQCDDEPRSEFRWWQMGVSGPCTWAKAYEIIKAAGHLMIRLVPDPAVDSPDLPWRDPDRDIQVRIQYGGIGDPYLEVDLLEDAITYHADDGLKDLDQLIGALSRAVRPEGEINK